MVGAYDSIMGTEKGFDSPVEERGANFSPASVSSSPWREPWWETPG